MISWVIQNNETRVKQSRPHAEYYYNLVSKEQSRYIALHVGIFWGIGRFIIKNGDTIHVMIDQRSIFDHLRSNNKIPDPFIEKRIRFILQLVNQRSLVLEYKMIGSNENAATKILT